MQVNARELDLKLIDLDDDRYRTKYICSVSDSDIVELAMSIESVGIINPPIVSFDSGRYIVVSGLKRITAAKKIGLEKVFCQVCSETTISTYKIAIIDNSYASPYSELDKALIVRKLFELIGDSCIDSVLEILNCIPSMRMNKEYVNKLIRLDGLSIDVKNSISKGVVSPAIALEFDFLKRPDSEKLLYFLQQLKIGLNLQREFCNLVYEIAKINECGISDVLSGTILTDIINGSLDVSKKRELILSELRKIRSPHIEKAKKIFFETAIRIVNNDTGISFIQPKNMDSSELSVSFSFKTRNDFKRIAKKLEEIGDCDDLDTLLLCNTTI